MKKVLLILLVIICNYKLMVAQEYADASVLSNGIWHKVKIQEEGIYRINYSDLVSLGLSAGSEAALYSNNNGILSFYNDDPRPDDLVKTPVFINRGSDGVFNSGDYILFYCNSTHRWKYDYEEDSYKFFRHYYSDTAVVFIRLNEAPLEIAESPDPGIHNIESEESDFLFIHEYETENILKSGREWYQPIAAGNIYDIEHNLDKFSVVPDAALSYNIRALARSEDPTVIRLNLDNEEIHSLFVPEVNIYNTAGTYARMVDESGQFQISDSHQDLSVVFYNNGNHNARAWLDYFSIQTRIRNVFNQNLPFYIIRDSSTAGQGNITKFTLQSPEEGLFIWDISDEKNIKYMQSSFSSGKYSFSAETDSIKSFIAFKPGDARQALIEEEPVPNQNLHQTSMFDMLILTHPDFHKYASELADLHYNADGYESNIVTPEQIYNEFSGGIQDISAIRNYIRMVYTRNKDSDKPLKYLLLFGDGSYENKKLPPDNPNFIPTYQTQNSHIRILSFTSDDYYGLLDEGEGEFEGYIDIGIGRLPASDTLQAATLLQKITDYLNPGNSGPWQNVITMIADDEDNNIHMNDADNLAQQIEEAEPSFNIEKIYLDSYRQVTSVNGDAYPDATRAINDRINNGCLIVNYAGHGNEIGLAHERVVNTENINSWSNKGKYPVFVTATCEFSRFEDIDIDPGSGEISQKSSAGELVLLNPEGGAIALLTTTRIVFASHNYNLASRLYANAFTKDEQGKGLTLGTIMKTAKNAIGGENKRNFTLLGDPALRLNYPWYGKVVTDSINSQPASVINDTIKALSKLTISGHITNNGGEILNSVNGFIYPVLYDKEYEIKTLANDGGLPFTYMTRDRVLFRGKTEVKNGRFSISMLIPRDIDYTYGNGKINYFASDSTANYAGFYDDLIIGGFNNSYIPDTTGPEIKLYLNDTLFRSGGITDPDPVLLAHLSDPGSINTTGTGIGHDIVAVIDEDMSSSIVLNNYYENDLGSYQSGKIIYPLSRLEKGEHSISLKAWDNYNNSASSYIVFFVRDGEDLILDKLINYPNPFIGSTQISLEHNRPGKSVEILINIFNRSGSLIKTIETTDNPAGFRLNPVRWDGRNDNGNKVAAGIYIYTVQFKTEDNETAYISGRMVIL